MLRGQKKKDYQKKYMERKRSNKDAVRPTELVDPSVRPHPSILKALVDPDKRIKLEKVYQTLKDFKQAENVYYGVSGVPFDVVGDLLEVTK